MTGKEAHKIFLNKMKGFKAIKCYEYATLFVFQFVPNNYDTSKSTDTLLDCLSSVNKKTGEVRDFKPFFIPLEEYQKGREVKHYR